MKMKNRELLQEAGALLGHLLREDSPPEAMANAKEFLNRFVEKGDVKVVDFLLKGIIVALEHNILTIEGN